MGRFSLSSTAACAVPVDTAPCVCDAGAGEDWLAACCCEKARCSVSQSPLMASTRNAIFLKASILILMAGRVRSGQLPDQFGFLRIVGHTVGTENIVEPDRRFGTIGLLP